MGRLVDEDTGYLQLFHIVLPAFIEALPPRSSAALAADRKQETLKNTISILRFEIQEMQEVLTETRADHDLIKEDIFKASDALEDILFCLEDLVDINADDHSDPSTNYPRLGILRDRILGYDANPALNFPSYCPDAVLRMISYGKEAAHYRRTIRAAQDFNRIMRSIFDSLMVEAEYQMPQIFQQQHLLEDDSTDQDTAMAEIYQARVVCETAKDLFNLLTEKPKACQTPHSALIHLTGFGQPEIDMIMSLCVENKTKEGSKKWHQVYWTSNISSNACVAPESSAESICSVLKRSRKFKSILRVYLQKDGSWKCAAASTADRMKGYAKPPELTLEELLNARQDGSGGKLLKKDKLDLAVAIARSLLHLSSSPLLQGQWSAENIYVAQSADEGVGSGLRTKPYIVRELDNEPPVDEPEDSPNINRFVLDVGVLIWQLLFGRKVKIQPEDEEDEDEDDPSLSLFNALNREHGNSQELFVEKPCLDIIANCLNLYSLCQLDEQTFRERMYWDVVAPLKTYLESFYQSQKPPSAVHRVKEKPLRTRTSSMKSEIERKDFSRMSIRPQVSLRKGVTVKNVHDITVRPKSMTPLRSTFAESNLLASSSNIKDSHSWLDKFSLLNIRLKTLEKGNAPSVRVAVLDTGCDIYHDYFDGPGIGQDERLDGHWLDCVAGSDEMVDEDPEKHGTAILTLLLRLLPGAEIFVVRVAKNTEDLAIAQKRIAQSIRYVAQEPWDVDIVSLSFGFAESAPCIEEAISYAEKRKEGKILFFAAANNQGRNQKEMFPAWCESVISVRGTSHDGSFVSRYNPDTWSHNRGTELYGTISENVPCDWISGKLVKSGCSVATPIVAAIAAMIIWFVSSKAASFADIQNVQGLIRTRRGMLSVFSVMTEDQEQPRRYLAPWQLFEDSDVNGVGKVHAIGYGLSRLPRQGAR